MQWFGKKDAEKRGPDQGQAFRPDVVSGFPRGLPDDDPYRLGAIGRWPSSAELETKLETWRPGLFLIGKDNTGRYVGHIDDRHILSASGSRAGKGVSLIVPNLLYWPGSVVAIDPKGELATLTAVRRSGLKSESEWALPMDPGHGKVHVLDPFHRVSGPAVQFRAAFNPLADLDPDTDQGLDMAWQIADALVIQSQGEGAHWTQNARTFLRGLILYVAATEEPASRTLIRVREILTQDKTTFAKTLKHMHDIGGLIGRTADALNAKPPTERRSVVSTCETHTAFLEGESMKRVLGGSDFRLEDLKSDRVSIYLCLPAMRLATHGRWLRLIITLAMEAMERTGAADENKPRVLFCLDEFAALGHMESVEKAAGQIAGFGVKLWPVIQDLTQLQRDYKEAWETFMGNAGLLTFFGNTDVTTTEHIAKRLGEVEVIRRVRNVSQGWQQSEGQTGPDLLSAFMGQGTRSTTDGTTASGGEIINEQVMRGPLMSSSEIGQFFSRDAWNVLASIPRPDLPPFALRRCSYHSKEDDGLFGGLFDPVPGQKPPKTTARERKERDTARLWHVPVG